MTGCMCKRTLLGNMIRLHNVTETITVGLTCCLLLPLSCDRVYPNGFFSLITVTDMSNDAQKADQIAFHFYTKLFHVVNEARATVETRNQSRLDKWASNCIVMAYNPNPIQFNLETPDSDLFTKEARDRYKSVSGSQSQLQVQVLLTVPDVNNNQVLVHIAPDSSRLELRPTPKQILLENWVLAFTPRDTATDEDVSLPKIYKHGIPLFRSLYSLLRILPAWKLCKRLRRRIGSNANLSIQLGINQDDSGILGFGK